MDARTGEDPPGQAGIRKELGGVRRMERSSPVYQTYVKILERELVPAMGCTEPIAIAYCAAVARSVLGELPDRIHVEASGNIIKNVKSGKMGKKDIIKIDSPMEVDLDVLGYIDPNITVNIIRNGVRVEKKHLELPKKLVNVIHCKNPRCITVAEPQLDAIFLLSDPATHTYRCAYCETAKDKKF